MDKPPVPSSAELPTPEKPIAPPHESRPTSGRISHRPVSNHEKLKELIVDVFLLEPEEYHLDLARDDVDTWDSLGIVSMAVGVQDTFGYHFTPEEATGIQTVRDIVRILESRGVGFGEDAGAGNGSDG